MVSTFHQERNYVEMGKAAGITFCQAGCEFKKLPVICLHGIGGNYTSFEKQINELGQRRVISWNMPGYYGSEALEEMTFLTLAKSVIKLMDNLGINQAHILGQSIGGMIAQEVALLAPNRVSSLGLIATTSAFGGKDDSFKNTFVAARLQPLNNGATMQQLAQKAIPSIMGPTATSSMKVAAIQAMSGIDEAAFRQVVNCLVTFNRLNDQHRITHPCFLIAGSHDTNSPPRIMERMAKKLPDATIKIIKNTGHLVNSEAPNEVNKLLTSFYKNLCLQDS